MLTRLCSYLFQTSTIKMIIVKFHTQKVILVFNMKLNHSVNEKLLGR